MPRKPGQRGQQTTSRCCSHVNSAWASFMSLFGFGAAHGLLSEAALLPEEEQV